MITSFIMELQIIGRLKNDINGLKEARNKVAHGSD